MSLLQVVNQDNYNETEAQKAIEMLFEALTDDDRVLLLRRLIGECEDVESYTKKEFGREPYAVTSAEICSESEGYVKLTHTEEA